MGSSIIIGGICNRPEHLAQRVLEGADYVGVGPWRMTQTKAKLAPILGAQGLKSMIDCNRVLPRPLPLVAIGGIRLEDIPLLRELGVDGFAVSGLINHAPDIGLQTKRLIEALG